MKLDDVFRDAKRLQAPPSLKARVMREIRTHEQAAKAEGWMEKIKERLTLGRAAWSLAAAAAALVMAISLFPAGEHVKNETAPENEAEIAAFMEDTLGPVFSYKPADTSAVNAEQNDLETYMRSQLEEIFWINGNGNGEGNNA